MKKKTGSTIIIAETDDNLRQDLMMNDSTCCAFYVIIICDHGLITYEQYLYYESLWLIAHLGSFVRKQVLIIVLLSLLLSVLILVVDDVVELFVVSKVYCNACSQIPGLCVHNSSMERSTSKSLLSSSSLTTELRSR